MPRPRYRQAALTLVGFTLALWIFPARAETVTGPLDKIEPGGAQVSIAGRTIALSPSRTNICVGGICDQGVDKLKAGMTCAAELADHGGGIEARRLSCR